VNHALLACCVALLLTPPAAHTAERANQNDCAVAPLASRPLYLRGTFNSWNATERQRLTWVCNRYQLVTRIEGQHSFKIADEGWSGDADFGSNNSASALALKGAELHHHFSGVHRFTLTMDTSNTQPGLHIESCPTQAPLGSATLFLRGSMNNWAALDEYAFQYSCDAYYLNVNLPTRHEFRIGDAAWSEASSFGSSANADLTAGGTGNLSYDFAGEHTIRLAFAGDRPQLSIGNKTFADPSARRVTEPLALSLRFNSRSAVDKAPFGAVVAGSLVSFGVTAQPGINRVTLVIEKRRLEGNQELLNYTEVTRVTLQRSTQGKLERWTAGYSFNEVSIYGYWFEIEIGDKVFVYQNNSDAVFWTREKGSGGVGDVADKPLSSGVIRRFRQTVYAADFKVPEWAPDIVYYYIFPDRFRNGDQRNDPQPGISKYHGTTVELHQNWLEKPWKPGSGDGSDNTYNNDFFGGDLAGIIEKLDYIRDLGANTIYMTPVFKAASNHKYDTADYKNIDPAFGSNAEFTRLTQEAKKRGIRVITDTSLNHTGSDSIYFDRFANYKSGGAFEGARIQSNSPYLSWYSFDARQSHPDRQFKGWVGVTDLPELNKTAPAFRQYAYRDPDSVMKLWLDRGAAGWRMDVVPWVSDDFWREWRRAIKQHRPDALTVAETWFDASKYFLGDMFDSTMNYIFRNTVLEYAAGGKASELYRNIELMREAYPPQAFFALMNLLSTHDQARSLHYFGWHDDTTKEHAIALAKQRLRLAVFFQMTFPGAPTVYYGDEVGVTGGDDPYNRAPYPWADLGGKPDIELLADFKRLIGLRRDNPVLRRGSIEAPLLLNDHVIVLLRKVGDQVAITATNNARIPESVTVALPNNIKLDSFVDALTGASVQSTNGQLTLSVPALFGIVLLSH
jgi:glycosidase